MQETESINKKEENIPLIIATKNKASIKSKRFKRIYEKNLTKRHFDVSK